MTVTHLPQKRHRLRKLRGETAYHDATAARLHIATLLGHGWSVRSIGGTAGVPATTVSSIRLGKQLTAAPETLARLLAVDPDTLAASTTGATAEPFVPRVGAVRRLQALLFMGWTHAALTEHSGVRTAVVLNQAGRWVTRSTHDAIAATYDALAMRPGPSTRTAGRARRLGYLGPLSWDNIDADPWPALDHDDDHDGRTTYLLEEYDHLTSCGVPPRQACLQLGVTPDAVTAARKRAQEATA